jgi:hypothetical protein
MATGLTAEIFQDDIAISLARAMAAANRHARELGIDVLQTLITINQRSFNGDLIWQIHYGPKEYVGRRGGDLIIEVDPSDVSIKQVLWGQ